jgi:hypothetical protein
MQSLEQCFHKLPYYHITKLGSLTHPLRSQRGSWGLNQTKASTSHVKELHLARPATIEAAKAAGQQAADVCNARVLTVDLTAEQEPRGSGGSAVAAAPAPSPETACAVHFWYTMQLVVCAADTA